MAERREMGSLEAEVLAQLWAAGRPATPAEVLDALGDDLAYTTVTTILTRLLAKGLVERTPAGRGFAYRPAMSEADLAAQRMRSTLDTTRDREAALSRFVGTLSEDDEAALRRILGE